MEQADISQLCYKIHFHQFQQQNFKREVTELSEES